MRCNYIEKILRVILEEHSHCPDGQRMDNLCAKAKIILDRDDNRAASVMKELDNNQL